MRTPPILVLIALLGAGASSCGQDQQLSGRAPSPQPVPARALDQPSLEQIERDLEQKTFFYRYRWSYGGTELTTGGSASFLGNPEILTDSANGTAEVVVNAEIPVNRDGGRVILSGPVLLKYKKFDQGWRVQEVRARDGVPGGSFAFDERPG